MSKNNLGRLFQSLVLALILLTFPIIVNYDHFLLHLVIMTGIYIMLTASLRLVFTAGIWHVGQSAFYAIGAYTLTLLMRETGLSFWFCLPLAGIFAAIVALIIGPITLRVKGIYFAILSIALVEVVRLTFIKTVGANERILSARIPDSINIPHLLTIDFTSKTAYYYLILAAVVLTLFILYRLESSRFGGILKSIARSDLLSESIGINVIRYKVLALSICSFFAGITGALFAPYNGIISPENFTVWTSMLLLILLIVGGIESFWGPVIGPIFLTILPEYLPTDPIVDRIIYGCLIILTLSFLPKGLVTLPRVVRRKLRS